MFGSARADADVQILALPAATRGNPVATLPLLPAFLTLGGLVEQLETPRSVREWLGSRHL
jgi:hypothetical protein